MSRARRRLDRLYPALTARERAVLVLRWWKEGAKEDPQIRWRIPPGQASAFDRYTSLMCGVNAFLISYVSLLKLAISQLDQGRASLLTLHLWALDVSELAGYIVLFTKEPITRSEYQQHLDKAREEMVAASELAEILAERHDDWTEHDLEAQDGEDESVVTSGAWHRVLAEKERDIAQLVDQGTLVGKRKGRRLLVSAGSFSDWLGEPVPLVPDWGSEYQVFSDTRAEEVHRLQRARRHVQEICKGAPLSLSLDLPRPKSGRPRKCSPGGEEIAEAVSAQLQEGIQERWREVRAVELVLGEVAGEFDGEDPVHPRERQALDGCKKRVKELHHDAQTYLGSFKLPEPEEEDLEQVRDLIQREGERYR